MRYAAIAAAIFNSAMLLFGPTAVEPKQCYKGYCEKVVCKPISASECDGLVVPNASDCACCDYCVKQLGETDSAVLDRGKEERAKGKRGQWSQHFFIATAIKAPFQWKTRYRPGCVVGPENPRHA
ncbi:hypothetical protein V5799_027535 [Amblyomma americanum]|uniref:Secreted protein n=1 Tax=Amblyomma americanum TaxID=6943 RepID=A0AAQ4DFG1_AMBAM